jgi:hypothetical protein
MERVAHVTPHAWAIGALTDALEGAGPVDVASDLAVLAGYAAALLVAATVLFRRTLTRGA